MMISSRFPRSLASPGVAGCDCLKCPEGRVLEAAKLASTCRRMETFASPRCRVVAVAMVSSSCLVSMSLCFLILLSVSVTPVLLCTSRCLPALPPFCVDGLEKTVVPSGSCLAGPSFKTFRGLDRGLVGRSQQERRRDGFRVDRRRCYQRLFPFTVLSPLDTDIDSDFSKRPPPSPTRNKSYLLTDLLDGAGPATCLRSCVNKQEKHDGPRNGEPFFAHQKMPGCHLGGKQKKKKRPTLRLQEPRQSTLFASTLTPISALKVPGAPAVVSRTTTNAH